MTSRRTIDLNADVGEYLDLADAAIIALTISADMTCAGHAGDERTRRSAVAPARQYGAGIGAHPGYPDREGFGRNRRLRAGTTLVFGTAIDGARCYLAAGGGIDAEEVPGSASADPVAYMGPSDDGPLDAGEPIAVRPGGSTEVRRWPTGGASSGIAKGRGPVELAIVEGPHLDRFPAGVRETPAERRWTVSARADRTGADWLRRTAAMLA